MSHTTATTTADEKAQDYYEVLQVSASRRLELFVEAFNATNKVVLNNGSGTLSSRTAFIPTSSRAARQTQLGVRFGF